MDRTGHTSLDMPLTLSACFGSVYTRQGGRATLCVLKYVRMANKCYSPEAWASSVNSFHAAVQNLSPVVMSSTEPVPDMGRSPCHLALSKGMDWDTAGE